MIATLHLAKELRDRIAAEARAAFPKECCGLIEGTRKGQSAHATAIHPTSNLADAPDRFAIDPAEQIRVMRAAREAGRAIIGCYHSHPNGRAEPSAIDLENAFEEDFLWLIAAIEPGAEARLSAHIFRSGAFAPVCLARAQGAKV
ncbi:MAG TPA: M67 family metallopeptidase [Rhizomicrobium sp.]|nr:M67 family metallopeptidase [Rhizomicrobium sp.]